MSDLISRQAVLELTVHLDVDFVNSFDPYTLAEIYRLVKEMPSVENKVEPKTGHWIKIGDKGLGYSDMVICKCSECECQKEFRGKIDGHNLIVDMEHAYKYCPDCGVKMMGGCE